MCLLLLLLLLLFFLKISTSKLVNQTNMKQLRNMPNFSDSFRCSMSQTIPIDKTSPIATQSGQKFRQYILYLIPEIFLKIPPEVREELGSAHYRQADTQTDKRIQTNKWLIMVKLHTLYMLC